MNRRTLFKLFGSATLAAVAVIAGRGPVHDLSGSRAQGPWDPHAHNCGPAHMGPSVPSTAHPVLGDCGPFTGYRY